MTKVRVRERAAELGLRTASKPDSQDICFVTSGDYRDFLRDMLPELEGGGDVLDMEGSVVGHHEGTVGFTIGQRKGLGVSVGEPRYVVDIEVTQQTITIGRYEDLLTDGCVVSDMAYTNEPISDGDHVEVKVRYRSDPLWATAHNAGDTWRFTFDEPQTRPAPGQTLVMYDGEYVLGGGIIVE
jgi:tRNA-specific 2-thiouridylase